MSVAECEVQLGQYSATKCALGGRYTHPMEVAIRRACAMNGIRRPHWHMAGPDHSLAYASKT